MGRSLYLFMKREIQDIVIIIEHVTFFNYIQTFIHNLAVKVNSTSRENYWGPSVWI
jgi:hypothetical protein